MTDSMLVVALCLGSMARCDALGVSVDTVKKELPIIISGRGHKWWVSARLLLGLSETDADYVYKYWAENGR